MSVVLNMYSCPCGIQLITCKILNHVYVIFTIISVWWYYTYLPLYYIRTSNNWLKIQVINWLWFGENITPILLFCFTFPNFFYYFFFLKKSIFAKNGKFGRVWVTLDYLEHAYSFYISFYCRRGGRAVSNYRFRPSCRKFGVNV